MLGESSEPRRWWERHERAVRAISVGALAVCYALLAVTLLFGDGHAMSDAPFCDSPERLWNYWRCREQVESVAASRGILQAVHLALVEGYPPWGNTLDFWLLAWPLDRLFDFPQSWNLQAVCVVVLNGLAATWLAWVVVGNVPAAIAAGVVCALNPWVLTLLRRGSIREACMVFPLLLAASLWRLRARKRLVDALSVGLMLALSAVWYWFYGLLCLLFVGVAWVWTRVERSAPPIPARHLLLSLLLACAVSIPFFASYIEGGLSRRMVTWGTAFPTLAEIYSLPHDDQRVWHGIDGGSLRILLSDSMTYDYLWIVRRNGGQVPLLLAIALFAVAVRPRQSGLWTAVLGFFYVLSLGPYLRTGSDLPSGEAWRLPYTWFFQYVPFFARLFHPEICTLFVVMSLSVTTAIGLSTLSPLTARPWLAWTGAAVVILIYLGQLFGVPAVVRERPTWQIPGFYRSLAARDARLVIELPIRTWSPALMKGPLIYQIVHGKPVLLEGGRQEAEANAFVGWLKTLGRDPWCDAPSPVQARAARSLGDCYVVVHELDWAEDARSASACYDRAVAALTDVLGQRPTEFQEFRPSLALGPPPHPSTGFRMSVFGPRLYKDAPAASPGE